MLMPERQWSYGSGYRYGFNGKENDNEVKGTGNQQDYGMRIYDPRIGKFLSVDPLTKKYPELTPYQFASNRTIQGIDLDGKEVLLVTGTGTGFGLFSGFDIGAGFALGPKGIALLTTQAVKMGMGLELSLAINFSFYPTMKSLGDLKGESWGASISGAYGGKIGFGVNKSGGHWGGTISPGVGVGLHASVDFSMTTSIAIFGYDEAASKIQDKVEIIAAMLGIDPKMVVQNKLVDEIKSKYKSLATEGMDKTIEILQGNNKKLASIRDIIRKENQSLEYDENGNKKELSLLEKAKKIYNQGKILLLEGQIFENNKTIEDTEKNRKQISEL
jgi:RHS repeat-associated protein